MKRLTRTLPLLLAAALQLEHLHKSCRVFGVRKEAEAIGWRDGGKSRGGGLE
jgi:hypothetical protein